MWDKKRGFIYGAEIIPLVIALAVSLAIIVSIGIPIVNNSLYEVNVTTNASAYNNTNELAWTGSTNTIISNVQPLVAVLAIVIVGAAILSLAGKND